jgi:hypothetical protein
VVILSEVLNMSRDEMTEMKNEKGGSPVKMIFMVIAAIAAGIGVAYLIYRYFRPDYLDSFNDDFDDDFEDDFFEDEDDGSSDADTKKE